MIREGSIRMPFTYAAGGAASRFLATLRDDGRILATPCPACRRVLCPACSFCPRCGEHTDEPVVVGPAGTVISFTELASGEVFGLVRLDGADTALLHRLLDPAGPWTIAARVRARLARQRRGDINDIEGFEPTSEEPQK